MPTNEWDEIRESLAESLRQRGVSEYQAAEEMGIAHTTLKRLLTRESGVPYSRTREAILRWIAGPEDPREAALQLRIAGPEGEDEEVRARTILGDPNMLRRVLGSVPKENYKVKIAIFRQYEDVLLEHGFPPPKWPQWFRELREEILGDREEERGTRG